MKRFNRGIKTVETRPLTPKFDLLGVASRSNRPLSFICILSFLNASQCLLVVSTLEHIFVAFFPLKAHKAPTCQSEARGKCHAKGKTSPGLYPGNRNHQPKNALSIVQIHFLGCLSKDKIGGKIPMQPSIH